MTFSPTVLKLNSRFNTQTVASSMSANRSSSAAMLKNSGYGTFGTNKLFTPSWRTGGVPQYMSSGTISRAVNGQNMSFVSGGIPAYSGMSYTQNLTMGTSNAFNTGMGIGATLNLALQLAGGLKELGLFGNKEAVKPQGAGDQLTSQVSKAFGNTASSVISSGNTDIQSLISGMESASTQDSAALRSAITSAKAQLGAMEGTKADLQNDFDKAKTGLQQAQTDFQKAGEGVSTAKGKVSLATRKKDEATLARNDAITAFADSKAAKGTAKNAYYKAVGNTTAADNDFKTATTRHEQAQGAVTTAQGNLDRANAMPETTSEEKAAKQTAVTNAKAELNAAKAKEEAAKEALKQADAALKKAQADETTAKSKLSDAEKNEIKAEEAKNEATTALNESNKAVDEANNNLTEANSNVKIAENKEKDAKENFDKLNGAAGKLNTHIKDMQTLQESITKYEGKLSELETQETNKLNANKNENTAIDQKRTQKDGHNWRTDNKTSKSETRDLNTIARNNEENVRLSSLSDQSFAAKFANTKGLEMQINPDTEHTLYFKDGKQITESEYISAKRLEVTGSA